LVGDPYLRREKKGGCCVNNERGPMVLRREGRKVRGSAREGKERLRNEEKPKYTFKRGQAGSRSSTHTWL